MTSKLVDQALFLIGDVGTIGGMNWLEQQLLQREWVGLTDEDMDFLFPHGSSGWVQETVKIIEAKLKEKNKC